MSRDSFLSNPKVPKEESQKFVDIVTSKGDSVDKNFKSRYIFDKSKIKEICYLINKHNPKEDDLCDLLEEAYQMGVEDGKEQTNDM